MRILVVQQKTSQNHSQAIDFLAVEYPEAERIFVSDKNDMIQVLNRESVNLVLIDASKDWKHSTGLLDIIRDHHPNLPVILIPSEHSATPVALERELSQGRINLDMLHSTSPYIIFSSTLKAESYWLTKHFTKTAKKNRKMLSDELCSKSYRQDWPIGATPSCTRSS